MRPLGYSRKETRRWNPATPLRHCWISTSSLAIKWWHTYHADERQRDNMTVKIMKILRRVVSMGIFGVELRNGLKGEIYCDSSFPMISSFLKGHNEAEIQLVCACLGPHHWIRSFFFPLCNTPQSSHPAKNLQLREPICRQSPQCLLKYINILNTKYLPCSLTLMYAKERSSM
jgi:hypothetical protein